MKNLDLNHLIDLDALLSEGSVAGAARRLNLSAPAMSRRLAHLRHALGDPLFVQAGRGLVPTQRALDLRERVRTLIEEVRSILAPPDIELAHVERTFTLRTSDGVIGTWAAALCARLLELAPGITLRFVLRPKKSMEALRSGEVDLDLGVLDGDAPEIKTQTLLRAQFMGVVRADHPLARLENINVERFIAWPHVNASRRGVADGPIDHALAAVNAKRRVALVVPSFQAAMAMAMSSDFIAAIPEPFARWSAHSSQLHIFALPVVTPQVSIAMSWHPRHDTEPVHRWLREQIRQTTASVFKPTGGAG
ncbi:LysR family transcriptional regulator [Pseudomonas sp. MWU15-20650]|uniref:LysR family transcriptional regulator n=1 Tax=Pseudomonas sp. MWU15-20650 TaxID=2933107 RepID=UPI00200CA22E|nr:LysR family transcriptional regulator [Pseudomonas sp. MWU15-20650]